MNRLFILFFILAAGIASAQTVTFNGQIRERSEFDARSFTSGASLDAFHLLRTRFNVTARLDSQISAFVELQDARTFGQTRSTLNSGAPAFDLRQAYLNVKNIAGTPFSLRLGRQSVGYANERILGKVDWTNFGQSFDGAVVNAGIGDVSIDLLGLAVARNANNGAVYNRDVFLTGAWGGWKPSEIKATVQGFYLFDTPRNDSIRQNRHTTGIYINGTMAGFDCEVDGAMQFGDYIVSSETVTRESTISASMIGGRLGYTVADLAGLRLGIGYDRLSGQNPDKPENYSAFHTLYGTNHKYYGYADLILNVPAATKGLGLQDMIAQASISPFSALKLAADLHLFSLATDPAKALPALTKIPSQQIGTELDLTASFKATDALNVTGGFSLFDGDRDRYILTGRKTVKWGYVMTTVNF
jgi:hypothetical protein